MKKKILIVITLLIIVSAGLFIWRPFAPNIKETAAVQSFSLKKSTLVDSVLVSGTVISSNAENVYSKTPNYIIKEVYFEVGDKVKAGDVLAKLDTSALELDIKQTELNIKNAESNIQNENDTNSYSLENALNNVESAALELKNSQESYDKKVKLFEASAISSDELTQAESALKRAQLSYDNAQATLANVKNKTTSSARTNLEIQKLTLEKQKKSLSDAKLVAPIDGTITMSNAKVNSAAAGLLFVIEDTDNLIVSTAIGEYDISLIELGQEVIIKTDSTGDKEFLGTVSKIAPTAAKDTVGNTASTSNVQFDTEIAMKSADPDIKIGMNVRLTIKINEKQDIYYVPYDAISTEDDGKQYLYIIDKLQKEEKSDEVLKKLQVQTGMETDMYVEISSPDLQDGMQVAIKTGETK